MKKRIFKTAISLFLALTLTLGVTACNDGSDGDNGSGKGLVISTETVAEINQEARVLYNGTHEVSATDTEKYLVKDGASDYVVVIPSGAGPMLVDGKNDLLILFKKATGVSLSAKYDSDITEFTETDRYISLGKTKLVEMAGIDESEFSNEKLKDEGIRIITKNNSVFLLGGSDFGVNNAVYKFLEIYFNFDYYHSSCIEIDQNVRNCYFKNIDVTDVPDIDHFFGADYVYHWGRGSLQPLQSMALGAQTASEEVKYSHHRAGNHASTNDLFMPVHTEFDTSSTSSTIHNVLEYIPKGSVDAKCHSDGNQLCHTAHGDKDLVEQMTTICAEKIIFSLKNYTPDRYPYKNYITFTMEDSSDICNCNFCREEYRTIGYSGNLINFANKIAEKVDAWLEAQKAEDAEFHYAYREKFTILTYAYNVFTDPPVDENGVPLSEDVICHKRLGIWHVSSHGVSAHADVYDPKWPEGAKQIKDWKTITQNSCLWFWHNSGNVATNAYFSDGFTIYSNNFFELMAYAGYEYVYAAHFLNGGTELTAWQNLLIYVQNKLRWNCHADMDAYIKKYMKAMYKDGADTMYQLLQSERVHYADIVVDADENNRWGREIANESNYPYATLKGWLDLCDQAIEDISSLKETDPSLYTIVKQRIEIEASAHIYRIINLYGGKTAKPFSKSVLNGLKERIRSAGELSPGLKIAGVAVKDIV